MYAVAPGVILQLASHQHKQQVLFDLCMLVDSIDDDYVDISLVVQLLERVRPGKSYS